MKHSFSNEPPVYSKPKPQSGPPGSRPSQQDPPSRPLPPVPHRPPPPIASPLAPPSPSRPTPPPKPQITISSAIPLALPPSAHAPHSDSHSPPQHHHRTVSLDPVISSASHSPYHSRFLPRSRLCRRLYFHPLHSPCTAPILHTIGRRPSEQVFNLSLLRPYGMGPHQSSPRNPFRVLPGGLFFRASRILARRSRPPT
jgi:hypothetical protein